MKYTCTHCKVEIEDTKWEAHQVAEAHKRRLKAVTLPLSYEEATTVLTGLKWVMRTGEKAMHWDKESIVEVTHVAARLEAKLKLIRIEEG